MSIKIVRIIARLNIGGPARNAVLLTEKFSSCPRLSLGQLPVQGLALDSWETVLVCGEVDKNEGDMMYLAQEKGIEPVIVRELGRDLSIRNDWRAFWKIYKIICRERPDIVHTHTAKAGTLGRLAGILYNLTRFKRHSAERIAHSVILVHTFHGHVFNGYFDRLKTLFFIWIERSLALFTDKIITVSMALKNELVHKYRIAPEEKIAIIELGFELDDLFKLPLREGSGIVNIGIIGRLTPIKNHKMLFRVLKKVTAYSLQLTAVVVGDGELREELENYARELGIEDMVEFKGWGKDLCQIYEPLDIVALTSLNEGTPVSLIEAMAAARPIVATDVGGVSDIVRDGKNGHLIAAWEEEEFGKKLMELIKDSDKRKRFGLIGRDTVKDRFSKERLIKDTRELYNNMLSRRRKLR